MAPHIPKMRENMARVLHIDVDQINVKATTEEGLGFTGSGEGISSQAICCLVKAQDFSFPVTEADENGDIVSGGTGGCAGCPGCAVKKNAD